MPDAENNSSSSGPRRRRGRWYQFRLRTLLAAVTVVAAAVWAYGVFVEPYRQQRRALEVVRQLGGRVVTAEAATWQRRLFGADFANITLIDLADCGQIDEYLPHVASLPCLETLVVGGEGFTDDHLGRLRLPKLTGLVLDSTSVSAEALAAWQSEHPAVEVYQSDRLAIEALPRRGHAIDYRFGENHDHPQLETLVGAHYFLEVDEARVPLDAAVAAAAPIRRLRHLKAVRIYGDDDATDADLAPWHGCQQVRQLGLAGTALTDDGLAHIGSLMGLESLAIFDARQTSNEGLRHLASLARLKSLTLDGPRITDVGMAHVRSLKTLRQLDVSGPGITDAGLKHVALLRELETVCLQDTEITDACLPYLKELPRLGYLDLRRTRITDAGLVHLRSFPKLVRLWVSGTRVTEAGLEAQGLYERMFINLGK